MADAVKAVAALAARAADEEEECEDVLFQQLSGTGLLLSALVQRSEGWRRQRAFRITASDFAAACGLSRWAAPRHLWARLCGHVQAEAATGADVARGVRLEPIAVQWYARHMQAVPRETGLWTMASASWLGASPDALLGEDGLLEVKCPRNDPHAAVTIEHMAQVQGQLHVTGREWCDLLSFTQTRGVAVFRVRRSEGFWSWMYPRLERFFCHVEAEEEPPPPESSPEVFAAHLLPLCSVERLPLPREWSPKSAV